MDKPWYMSKTAWGAVLLGGGTILTSIGGFLAGNVDANTCLTGIVAGIGVILVAVGLRDAIGKN